MSRTFDDPNASCPHKIGCQCYHCKQERGDTIFNDSQVAYVISRYTTANSSYKRHIIDANGQPLCKSNTRSYSLEYTTGQSNCLRCLKKRVKQS